MASEASDSGPEPDGVSEMTSDRGARCKEIFEEAIELPIGERTAFVAAACEGDPALLADVASLLSHLEDAHTPLLESPPDVSGAGEDLRAVLRGDTDGSIRTGSTIGRYTLLERLGEGAFGTVWAAEQQEPVTRRVAIKIIKLGMDTRQVIARFEAERQALAMMDHPNIAKIFDGGSTEHGRPYFVMELVRGTPIVDYCDTERLDARSRLDLFITVCHAIQHAHQKGIIHRDIKPSNVLVALHDGVPVPKVIDFGIAKATEAELTHKTVYTLHRQMIGTPAYMSPEQAEMSGLDIDTRSDIYSLGVLLYELLTGSTPADESLRRASLLEMMRIIREEEPESPSSRLSTLGDSATRAAERRSTEVRSLSLLLRGDLDWIVMKCLEKDRTRRYDTANALAADVRRHLDDEPVVAGPPSRAYRLRKFVRRHRAGVLAGSLMAAILVVGLAGTTFGLLDANAQRRLAAERADQLQQVADFQAHQLDAVVPELMGSRLRDAIVAAAPAEERDELRAALARINFTDIGLESLRTNIFDPARAAIESQFDDQPLVKAQLLHAVAETMGDLGLIDAATEPMKAAWEVRRRELGEAHPDTLQSLNARGALLWHQGEPAESERLIREVLEVQRRVLGDDHPDTLRSLNNMGFLLQNRGRLTDALDHFQQALDGRRRVLGEDHQDTLMSLNNMGSLLADQGKLEDAEQFHRRALDGRRRTLGDDHPDTLMSLNNLAHLLQTRGKLAEAERYYQQVLDGRRRVLGADHPQTLTALNNMGSLRDAQGRLDEAESFYRRAMEGNRRVLGSDHPSTLRTTNNLGLLLRSRGALAEAERYCRQALDGRRRVLGDDHPDTLASLATMGFLLQAQDNLAGAESYYRQALEGRRRVLGDDHPDTLGSLSNVGSLLRDQGRLVEAESTIREVVDGRRRVLGDDHPRTLQSLNDLGKLLNALDRYDECETLARQAAEAGSRALGDDHWRVAEARSLLGEALTGQGRYDEAEPLLLAAYDRLEESDPDGRRPKALSAAARRLVTLYEAWGRPEQAEHWRGRPVTTD